MKRNVTKQNALSMLVSREYMTKNHYRHSYKVLRTLICRGKYGFKKVWEQQSGRLFSCESSTVLMDNYTKCYSGYGLGAAPVHRFTLPKQPGTHKIVDALLSRPRPTQIVDGQNHRPKMLAITSNNKLLVMDLQTGQCLQEVLVLGSRVTRLKNINWLLHEEEIVLSTTLCQRNGDGAGRNEIDSGAVKVMAVFKLWPLQFVCMFEVNKQGCGSDVVDAMMSQGMLITMHQSRLVRMYDLDDLLPQAKPVKLYEPVPSADGCFGQSPTPLPFNLKISELPRCLFEVRCEEHNIQLGGYPWHYIISPVSSRGCFGVYSMETHALAKNGRLDMDRDSIELDRATFHADESGRIIHIGPEEIRVLSIKPDNGDGSMCSLDPAFTITLRYNSLQQNAVPSAVRTASGRSVKRRISLDEISGEDICLTIHEVDYEDELDVLWVCTTVHQPDALSGTVRLHDNLTGKHLTSIKLDEPWPDYCEHNLHLDGDTIVQVVKSTNAKFLCQVYRLQELRSDSKAESDSSKKKRKKSDQQRRSQSAPRRRRR